MRRRGRRCWRWTGIVLAWLVWTPAIASPQTMETRIAAASDLRFAMDELVEQFRKHTPASISVSYGSSGNFFSQIQNGAPFALFFSADIDYPTKLDAAGLAEPETLQKYAVGQIAIWVPAKAEFDVATLGWQTLLAPGVQKIAIANPAHAPYGRAAVAAMQRAGIYEQVRAKLVYGENISQAAQFVQSGNAQAGVVALSLVDWPAMRDGRHWVVPTDLYAPIEQGVVILKQAPDKQVARSFLRFVLSPEGQAILRRHGFSALMKKSASG